MVLEFLLLINYSLSDQWEPKLRKSKKWGVLKKRLLKPKYFSKLVILHSNYPTESDSYIGPWQPETAAVWHQVSRTLQTLMSLVCPTGSGRWGFPKWQRLNSELLSFVPLTSPQRVCGSLVNPNAFNANTRCTMKRNVLLIYRDCTIYSNISSLPEKIPPLQLWGFTVFRIFFYVFSGSSNRQ